MDAVTGFLDGPRACGAFALRVVFDPPFAVDVRDDDALTLIAVQTGDAWLIDHDGTRTDLHPGDAALVTGGGPYVMADHPRTSPRVAVRGAASWGIGGSTASPPDNLCESMDLGIRTWGNAMDGSTALLIGSYGDPGEVGRGVVAALPRMAVLRAGDWRCPALDLLAIEMRRRAPGQQALLDRLLDVVVIDAVRSQFARLGDDAPGWFLAGADPAVGAALRLIEQDLGRPWTVTGLASTVGLSRAALARRFTDVLGQPPIGYLTRRRLSLAADLLADRDATVGRVSRQVGYASPFTFSAAFKREFGVSPSRYRATRYRAIDRQEPAENQLASIASP